MKGQKPPSVQQTACKMPRFVASGAVFPNVKCDIFFVIQILTGSCGQNLKDKSTLPKSSPPPKKLGCA